MKNVIFTAILALTLLLVRDRIFGQSPNVLNYQAVLRDNAGVVLANEEVTLRFSIHEGSPTGIIVYQETHATSTNDVGLVNVQIGDGIIAGGNWGSIQWHVAAVYLQVGIDRGSGGFVYLGTQQFVSVPYAISSEKATDMKLNDLNDVSGLPTAGEVLKWSGTTWEPSTDNIGGGGGGAYSAGMGITISASYVISADIGTDISTSELQNNAVTTGKIADDAVTTTKIDDMGATAGEVLEWNGTNWAPAPDDAGSGGLGGTTLDSAYHAGRTIIANIGAVVIAGEDGFIVKGTSGQGDTVSDYSGSGADVTKMFFNPGRGAFRVGIISNANWNQDSLGRASVAMGFNAKATGNFSTAMGRLTKASSYSSTAMGRLTEATGKVSTAMGAFTEASGDNSTAMGRSTEATGKVSTAMGASTKASGEYSTALGHSTEATGDYSTAMGHYTQATGRISTAMGRSTEATGNYSTAMGAFTVASNEYSTAMGNATRASGIYSTAMGHYTQAAGYYLKFRSLLKFDYQHSKCA